MSRRMFDYNDDIEIYKQQENPGMFEKVRQSFSPKKLGATILIKFQQIANEAVDIENLREEYGLKYDKVLCFRYKDLPLKPFFFTINAGQLMLVSGTTKYDTMIVTDLNTLMNILYAKVTVHKARRDGKIEIYGERIGYDEALFFDVFQKVAPRLRKRIGESE